MKRKVLFIEQKIYIKYRNFKDRLCNCIGCPFCAENEVIDTG